MTNDDDDIVKRGRTFIVHVLVAERSTHWVGTADFVGELCDEVERLREELAKIKARQQAYMESGADDWASND